MVNRRGVLKIGAAAVAGVLVKMPDSGRTLSPPRAHLAFRRAAAEQHPDFAE